MRTCHCIKIIIFLLNIPATPDVFANNREAGVTREGEYRMSATGKYDIVFSEIYFEPSSSSPLPNSEFIEIYNRSNSTINLTGWTITDGSSTAYLPAIYLAAQSFLLIFDDSDSADFILYPNPASVTTMPSLNNDVGDHLILSDGAGTVIDEVIFSNSSYHDESKKNGGWTIERIDLDFTCYNENNWHASLSSLHGSPGVVNSVNHIFIDSEAPVVSGIYMMDSISLVVIFSEALSSGYNDISNFTATNNESHQLTIVSVHSSTSNDTVILHFNTTPGGGTHFLRISSAISDCPGNAFNSTAIKFGFPAMAEKGDVLINEILFNCYNGGNDFLELYNSSAKIINLQKWVIAETDAVDVTEIKEDAIISTGSRLFFPGEYLVLSEDKNKVKSFYSSLDPLAFFDVATLPDFNSDEGRAVIYDHNGSIIDEMRYHENMHFPLIVDAKGVSLERLSFKNKNQEEFNWHSAAATAGFATPGYRNSQQVGQAAGDGEVSLDREIVSPDNDGYDDVLFIRYQFPKAGTVLSLNVYNYDGRLVKTLLSGATVGNEGIISWDGFGETRQAASSGIYILLAKIFHLDGDSYVIKKVFYLTRKM